jgi:hypothetical protein
MSECGQFVDLQQVKNGSIFEYSIQIRFKSEGRVDGGFDNPPPPPSEY